MSDTVSSSPLLLRLLRWLRKKNTIKLDLVLVILSFTNLSSCRPDLKQPNQNVYATQFFPCFVYKCQIVQIQNFQIWNCQNYSFLNGQTMVKWIWEMFFVYHVWLWLGGRKEEDSQLISYFQIQNLKCKNWNFLPP